MEDEVETDVEPQGTDEASPEGRGDETVDEEGVESPDTSTEEGPDSLEELAPETDTVDLEAADEATDTGEIPSLVGEIPWSDEQAEPITLVFAGGKGGAGRSLLAANVALFMASLGRDVVLADLDAGGPNLHTYLGLEPLLPTPGALLRRPGPPKVETLNNIKMRLVRPPWPTGSGTGDPLRAEALEAAQNMEGADLLVLDMGANADPLTLDTYLAADAGILVVLPEPASVERAYGFLRAALYRRLLHGGDEPAVVARALLTADQMGQLDTPAQLIDALAGVHPNAAEAIRARVMSFTPHILMNKCRTRADREMSEAITSALARRWGINATPLGGVEYDEAAWEATRRRRPLVLEYPGSTLGGHIERLSRRLLSVVGQRETRA